MGIADLGPRKLRLTEANYLPKVTCHDGIFFFSGLNSDYITTHYPTLSPLECSRKMAELGHEKAELSLGLLIGRPTEIIFVAALGKL